MYKESLDTFDKRPEAMTNYLRYYGWHFNKKMCDFAVSKLMKGGVKLTPVEKQSIDVMLQAHSIKLKNNELYDYVYVANMAKADFFGSSITDDAHLAKFIKDYIDDEDGYDGIVFSRWYIDTVKKGTPIDWDEML